MKIKTITNRKTKYNADCIDFCPIIPFTHIFVVGTYELVNDSEKCSANDNDNSCQRVGCLYLHSVKDDEVTVLQQIDMPGILDVRWCTHEVDGRSLLGVADAKGYIVIFSLDEGSCLKELCRASVTQNLSLYLDWSTVLIPCNIPLITVSDSEGYINIFSVEGKDLRFIQKIKAHQFEGWVTSFNYWNTNIVYSGGDDCKFKGYDIKSNAMQIFSSNSHTAGVTAIQHSLRKEYLLFSGCYDGNLNAWDLRNMKSFLSTTNLGGGVWRLRSEPFKRPLIVASTMHNGFHILEIDEDDRPKIIGSYCQHESLAYGADWSKEDKGSKHLIGSVSFYDKLLSLWDFVY